MEVSAIISSFRRWKIEEEVQISSDTAQYYRDLLSYMANLFEEADLESIQAVRFRFLQLVSYPVDSIVDPIKILRRADRNIPNDPLGYFDYLLNALHRDAVGWIISESKERNGSPIPITPYEINNALSRDVVFAGMLMPRLPPGPLSSPIVPISSARWNRGDLLTNQKIAEEIRRSTEQDFEVDFITAFRDVLNHFLILMTNFTDSEIKAWVREVLKSSRDLKSALFDVILGEAFYQANGSSLQYTHLVKGITQSRAINLAPYLKITRIN